VGVVRETRETMNFRSLLVGRGSSKGGSGFSKFGVGTEPTHGSSKEPTRGSSKGGSGFSKFGVGTEPTRGSSKGETMVNFNPVI